MKSQTVIGTPKNLDELTINILTTPWHLLEAQIPHMIRDYLAQKFGPSLLLKDELADELAVVFNRCCARRDKKNEG